MRHCWREWKKRDDNAAYRPRRGREFFLADALVPHLIVDLSTDLSTRSFGSSVPVPLISLWICFHAPSQSSRPFAFSPRSDSSPSSSAFRGSSGSVRETRLTTPAVRESSERSSARRRTSARQCVREGRQETPESTYLKRRRVGGEPCEQPGDRVRRGSSLAIAT